MDPVTLPVQSGIIRTPSGRRIRRITTTTTTSRRRRKEEIEGEEEEY